MRTLAITIRITGAKVSAVSSTGMPSMCATIMAESVDEAVRVARCVPSLEAGLVHSAPTEVVAVREEPRVDGHATRLDVRLDARDPRAHAIRVEDRIPRRVERVGEVHAATIAAHLHQPGDARKAQARGSRWRGAVPDAS